MGVLGDCCGRAPPGEALAAQLTHDTRPVEGRHPVTITLPSSDISLEEIAQYAEKALAVDCWSLHTIPGLLQTEQYARALHASFLPPRSQDETDKTIEALLQQQSVLTAGSGPELTFILDESVLRRIVGGRYVMDRQLEHVWRCARLPRVTLQVAPLNMRHHPGLRRSSMVIRTKAQRMVLTEDHDGTATAVTDDQTVAAFDQHFTILRSYALTPEQSLNLIADIHEKLDE
jgi:Domain of unknown function (DUF5753)